MDELSGASRIAVMAAMVPELAPIVRSLGLSRHDLGPAVAHAHLGDVAGREVVGAVTAMGTVAASEATRRVLDVHRVDHVVVVGVAGAVDPTLRIGEVVVPDLVRDEASGVERRPVPLGRHRPQGTLLTTDQLHGDPDVVARLHRAGVVAVDMETAAIGAVAKERGIPWSVVRSISDRAGDPRVDAAVVAMSKRDGTADPRGIARFVVTRPHRLPALRPLARGLRLAVRSSTEVVLDAIGAPGG